MADLGSARLAAVLTSRPNLVASNIDDAAAKDRMAEAQVATAKAAIGAARQQLAVSKAMANKTTTLLEYTRITATFAGVITDRTPTPGR